MNAGLKQQNWELVGFAIFGIPTNQDEGEEIETELGIRVSSLYHFSERFQGLLELDGESVMSGEEAGEAEWNLTPGIKFAPLADMNFKIGLGVRVPLSDDNEFDVQGLLNLFYHL